MTELLTYFRKLTKKGTLPQQYTGTLPPILNAIIKKMEYDETASWGDEDEEADEAEFLELRKRLNILQQNIAAIDEQLYMDTLTNLVATTLSKLGGNANQINWRELDLALYEMYLFGDLASRNRGLYAKREPSSVAAIRLVEMMTRMMESSMLIIAVTIFSGFNVKQTSTHTNIPPFSCNTWSSAHATYSTSSTLKI